MAFELPPLPYDMSALAPHISEETLDYHYGKHHQKYVETANALVRGTADDERSLEDLIVSTAGPLFNQVAQIWNHTFYWSSMAPGGGGEPSGAVADAVNSAFDGYRGFREQFKDAATGHFGSGWAWLIADGRGLAITTTSDADTPRAHAQKPLLTCDVWEHAYYIDYRNSRPDYVDAFLDHLVNWDHVAAQMG